MLFCLENETQTFQSSINFIFQNFSFISIYIGDILFMFKDIDKHNLHLKLLFERIQLFMLVKMS